jgi:hypothetical protein
MGLLPPVKIRAFLAAYNGGARSGKGNEQGAVCGPLFVLDGSEGQIVFVDADGVCGSRLPLLTH